MIYIRQRQNALNEPRWMLFVWFRALAIVYRFGFGVCDLKYIWGCQDNKNEFICLKKGKWWKYAQSEIFNSHDKGHYTLSLNLYHI